jgi:hypothetical protein
MVKPAIVKGPGVTVEQLARDGNVSPERTRELVEIAREIIAKRARRAGRPKATRKAAAKRAPIKAAKR